MGILQPCLVHVCVDLRRGDIGVAEHFLDHAQVATVVEQVRGKAVPERVGLDVLGDPSIARVFLD